LDNLETAPQACLFIMILAFVVLPAMHKTLLNSTCSSSCVTTPVLQLKGKQSSWFSCLDRAYIIPVSLHL